MKQTIKLLAALAVLGFAGSAMAQTAVTASANVFCPLSMNASTTLNFGNIVGGESNAATVTIADAQTFSETYGAGADPGTGNYGLTRQQGTITLNGQQGFLWNLTSAPASVALTFTGAGSTNLTSAALTYSSTNGSLVAPSTEGPACSGVAHVFVGGSIVVSSATGIGGYSGTVNVTAAYN